MTCLEVQEVLPDLLDVPVDRSLPADFQSHLKGCPDCADLVSDLRSIATEAPQLSGSDEPSPLLWLRIAAQLRSEGLIREQERESDRATYRPSLVRTSPRPRWSLSWLVPVAAALIVAGTYVVKHQPAPVASRQQPPIVAAPSPETATVTPSASSSDATPANTAALNTPASDNKTTSNTAQIAQAGANSQKPIISAPSDDEQFLSVVSTRAPAMRTSYEKQLQAVNADIQETQTYVDQNPGDADAREHLMDAYQQKALLYQIALDRIQ